eukprot:XP_004920872.3 PREDICTED: mediator of RNA polymerase II transcription subunit 1-like [Xenopus tropicalis]
MRFYASLPGQQHCYFVNKDAPLPDGRSLQGTLLSKIPFQHPGRVPIILSLIRHQVACNTLIGSCVKRTMLKEDCPGLLQFEVAPLSDSCFSISFQHPVNDSLVCGKCRYMPCIFCGHTKLSSSGLFAREVV